MSILRANKTNKGYRAPCIVGRIIRGISIVAMQRRYTHDGCCCAFQGRAHLSRCRCALHCSAFLSMRHLASVCTTCRTVIWLTTRLLSHRRHPALFARFDEANSRLSLLRSRGFVWEMRASARTYIYIYIYTRALVARACVSLPRMDISLCCRVYARARTAREPAYVISDPGGDLGIRSHHTGLSTPTTVHHR